MGDRKLVVVTWSTPQRALLWVAGIIVSIWIAYEIIWRAVRRGMREFNADPQLPRNRPRAW